MFKSFKHFAAVMSIIFTVSLVMNFGITSPALADSYEAQYVAESSGSVTLHPGEKQTVWIDLRNSGTSSWQFGTPSTEVDLVSTDSSYSVNYGTVAAASSASVSPGSTTRFSFDLSGSDVVNLGNTQKVYLRPMLANGTFLPNLGLWIQVNIVPWPSFNAFAGDPAANKVNLCWDKYTGGSFGSYRIYRIPKGYQFLRYYPDGSWSRTIDYNPQQHPESPVAQITDVNTSSYQDTIEEEKTYVYVIDVCDSSGNVLARSKQFEVDNACNYAVKPWERGMRLFYDPTVSKFRNSDVRGNIESFIDWSFDGAEALMVMKYMPETLHNWAFAQNALGFLEGIMPNGLPQARWCDSVYDKWPGERVWLDPQMRFNNGLTCVMGDLSATRLTFTESTYGGGITQGSLYFGYTYDGIGEIQLSSPTTRTVTFNTASNSAVIEFSKNENNVYVDFKVTVIGGIANVEGTIRPLSGSISNPKLFIKTDGGQQVFNSLKTWTSTSNKSYLMYNDGQNAVRCEDLCKNNPTRFDSVAQSTGKCYFKYSGTLSSSNTWNEYLAKVRFITKMLGGTADYMQPTVYNSTQYDQYVFGISGGCPGYPVWGLADWCSHNVSDSGARTVLNSAFRIYYDNAMNYNSLTAQTGSMGMAAMGALLYGLSEMARVDSTTVVNGKTYDQMAQDVYNKMPSTAEGASDPFRYDNDSLSLCILGIRDYKGSGDSKASNYESHLVDVGPTNNWGYYTPKTYLSYTNKSSTKALKALSSFLQLPQWDSDDALVVRNTNDGYGGMGEAVAFGSMMYNYIEQNYGGVVPISIGTDSRHVYKNINVQSMSWNSGTRTFSMGFDNPFEELDVYTGSSPLQSVSIDGTTLTEGTDNTADYTFDRSTHILKIYKTNTAGNNFTINVTVGTGTTNLATNPGFESGLTGWQVSGSTSASYIGAGSAHGGSNKLVNYYPGSYNVTTTQTVTGLANGTYTFMAHVLADNLLPDGASKLIVRNYGGPDLSLNVPCTNSQWAQVQITDIKVTNGQCQFGFNSNNGGNCILFDDVTFFKQTEQPNLVADPGFENGLTGWQVSGSTSASYVEAGSTHWGNNKLVNYYPGSYNVTTSQTITGLQNNTMYTLSAYVLADNLLPAGASQLVAKNYGGADIAVNIPRTNSKWVRVQIPNIRVTNGQCQISVVSNNGGNCILFDDIAFYKQFVYNNFCMNPGFETDLAGTQNPTGWRTAFGSGSDGSEDYTEAGQGRSGNYALIHYAPRAYDVTTYQTINALENAHYSFSVYVKTDAATGAAKLVAKNYGGSDIVVNVPNSPNTWTRVDIPDINVTGNQCEIDLHSVTPGIVVEYDDAVFYYKQ
jgi:Carbohydrate binding domain.